METVSSEDITMKRQQRYRTDGSPIVWIVIVLVLGALMLAIIDESTRNTYTDLAKVGLGGYIALLRPGREQNRNRK